MIDSIHSAATIGKVHLNVTDLERSISFYRDVLGFKLHNRAGQTATLGSGLADLLVLYGKAEASPVHRTSGLYHFAVLVPSRLELAKSLQRLVATQIPVQGFSDHLVSEAIYLADPDGNGIEIYRDRPRDDWQFANGQLRMATEPLDMDGLMGEMVGHSEEWSGLKPATTIGHVHLHVGNLDAAQAFYTQGIGFDLIMRYGLAAGFVSAGGYHHHVGFNTWAGVGVPPPPVQAAGLRYFEIVLPNDDEVEMVASRLRDAGYAFQKPPSDLALSEGLFVRDPAHNGVLLVSRLS
jgi:catechol 2,3-dioxygenase